MTPAAGPAGSPLIERFAERGAAAGLTVACSSPEALSRAVGLPGQSVTLTPTTASRFPSLAAKSSTSSGAAIDVAVDTVRDLTFPVGISTAVLAVAETGSVLLDEQRLADRLVTLFSLRLVVLVQAADLVPTLRDVTPWLACRAGRPTYACLMTGPSRTADIERSLTVGVQGPRELHVVFVS
jgi:L-lactate dehydrogenase complex protein LldG